MNGQLASAHDIHDRVKSWNKCALSVGNVRTVAETTVRELTVMFRGTEFSVAARVTEGAITSHLDGVDGLWAYLSGVKKPSQITNLTITVEPLQGGDPNAPIVHLRLRRRHPALLAHVRSRSRAQSQTILTMVTELLPTLPKPVDEIAARRTLSTSGVVASIVFVAADPAIAYFAPRDPTAASALFPLIGVASIASFHLFWWLILPDFQLLPDGKKTRLARASVKALAVAGSWLFTTWLAVVTGL